MAQTVAAKQVVLKDSEGGYLLPYAGVAQKALKDNDGNDIPTTYAKKADLSGYLPVDGKAVDSAKADTATSAASATKATQDSAGQQINTTYIKNVSVNGRTITFTRGNGATFTITTQDTVTTNTSNWSVSNGTNGWARDNSTGFTIQWLQGSIGIKTDLAINFPRTFSLARSVVCGGIEWGGTDRSRAGYVGVQSYNNSQVVVMQPSGATAYSWLQFRIVAVGFS